MNQATADAGVTAAYRALLAEASRLHDALTRMLADARTRDSVDTDLVTGLEMQLARTTELIDLLESAVETAVAAATQPTR